MSIDPDSLPPRFKRIWDMADEIDAAVAKNLADPNYVPETVPQVPDPFGMNWSWVENALPVAATPPGESDPGAASPPARDPSQADQTDPDFTVVFSETVALPKDALFNRAVDAILPPQAGVFRLRRSTEDCESAVILWAEGEFRRLCREKGVETSALFAEVGTSLREGLLGATQRLYSQLRSLSLTSAWPIRSLVAVSIAVISTEIDTELFDEETGTIPAARSGSA